MKIDKKDTDIDDEDVFDFDEQRQNPKSFKESYLNLTQ